MLMPYSRLHYDNDFVCPGLLDERTIVLRAFRCTASFLPTALGYGYDIDELSSIHRTEIDYATGTWRPEELCGDDKTQVDSPAHGYGDDLLPRYD